jgi:hypothetical protein
MEYTDMHLEEGCEKNNSYGKIYTHTNRHMQAQRERKRGVGIFTT